MYFPFSYLDNVLLMVCFVKVRERSSTADSFLANLFEEIELLWVRIHKTRVLGSYTETVFRWTEPTLKYGSTAKLVSEISA